LVFVGEPGATDLHAAHQLRGADQGSGRLTTVSVVGADRFLPGLLSRRSRLGPLFRSFVSAVPLPEQPDAGQAPDRRDYIPLVFAAQLAAGGADRTAAAARARHVLTAHPHGEAAEPILGEALLKLGQYDEAVEVLARAPLRWRCPGGAGLYVDSAAEPRPSRQPFRARHPAICRRAS